LLATVMKTVSRPRRLTLFSVIVSCLVIVAVFIAPGLPVAADDNESQCWAVIIGISEYQNRDISTIPGCAGEARDIYQEFSPVWGEDNVRLLLDEDATKTGIKMAIRWLAETATIDDTVLIYFTGHGYENYLLAYDALYEHTYIAESDLSSWLYPIKARNIAIVLSTCHAGSFRDKLAKSGRVSLFSSRSDESSWGTHSSGIFGKYLILAIANFTKVDTNSNRELSMEELFAYAGPKTTANLAECNKQQHPLMQDDYPGELSVLVKHHVRVNADYAYSTKAISVDGELSSGKNWGYVWAPGSIHQVRVEADVPDGEGKRHHFVSWDDGVESVQRTLSGGGLSVVTYRRQYLLNIVSRVEGGASGGGWYDMDDTATISAADILEANTRHIFDGWRGDYSGTANTVELRVNCPKTVTADWTTEHYLAIESAYGEPSGAGWYEAGSSAVIAAPSSVGFPIQRKFTGWSGDINRREAVLAVVVKAPLSITANWRNDYTMLYVLSGGGLALVLAIYFSWRKLKAGKAVPGDERGLD